MKVLRITSFGNPPTMSYDDAADPTPGPGEVVVQVEAAGVNPVDTYVAAGQYAVKPDLPYTPGGDAAGTVLSVGEGVSDFAEGDRVIVCQTTAGPLRGAFAERCVCKAEWLMTLPSHLTFAQGAAVNVAYITAFRALIEVGKPKDGDTVLIHGATGGVGLAALQIAKAHKLKVATTGGSDAGRDLLKKQGADVVLDHHQDGHLDALKDSPPDVILEMAAHVNLQQDIAAVAPHGRIVVIGNRGETTIDARGLMGKQAAVIGMSYFNDGDAAIHKTMAALQAGLDAGDLKPVVQAEVPMEDAQRAFDLVMKGDSHGKIVLLP